MTDRDQHILEHKGQEGDSMIIVPELQTVVILVPRTASGSLYKALLETYPRAFPIYRHMEADGVPLGYDRWAKVGVLRHPLDRLFSLYKFLNGTDGGSYNSHPDLWQRLNASAACTFEEWLTTNEIVFTSPYDAFGPTFWPQYSVRHPIPETRKSQFIHLRPDLGTEVIQFTNVAGIEGRLGVKLGRKNVAANGERPEMTPTILRHLERFHQWDLENVA